MLHPGIFTTEITEGTEKYESLSVFSVV